jgi:glycosyltransferase involved in cell wall biosynthesis
MDELSQLRSAPAQLHARERLLLSRADVVFTGGYNLYRAKSRYHRNVHFFGCGVDANHLGQARLDDTMIPSDAGGFSGPVLGYFGVIDERIDFRLLGNVAAALPECTLLMIGPVEHVDERDLPRAPNIHWLGQRSHDDLPRYLKTFDVALMPFAINDTTEFFNPAQTLEYLAAGRKVVSTPLKEVVRNFAPVVRLAKPGDDFVLAVQAAMSDESSALIQTGIERAAGASWSAIVRTMQHLISYAAFGRKNAVEPARERAVHQGHLQPGTPALA